MTLYIDTIGALIDSLTTLTVYCADDNCWHGKDVDLEKLAARIGRDHSCMHSDLIKLNWRCEKCGGRKVTFRLAPG